MQYDNIQILNELAKQIRGALGVGDIKGTVNTATSPDERFQPAPFTTEGHIKLRAVKSGKTQQVEFIQKVAFDEVRDPRVLRDLSDEFCKRAARALADIDVK